MRILFTMQLGALAGSVLGALGCGARTRRFVPDGSMVVEPGPGPFDCVPTQSSTLGLNEQTAFGQSSLDMLGSVLPGEMMVPFFWVGYDALDGPVSYSPGVSETRLRLSIWPREDAVVRQSVAPPTGVPCEPSRIEIAVHVAVETVDGALAETFDSEVSFEQRDLASLRGEVAPDAIGGRLALESTGALAAGWQLQKLNIGVSLWRGGTSGAVTPSFVKPASTTPPLRTGPSAQARSREGLGESPGIPLHWGSLGVWPRRERCAEGPAVDADERWVGWSPRDAMAALAGRATLSLVTEAGETPVSATFEEPSGLVCIGPGLGEGQMSFNVSGRLSADGATPGSPLEHLGLRSTFRVSAESAVDGSGITEMGWQRWAPDVTAIAESRAAFASSTGLVLDAADRYQLFWWIATAEQHRTAPSDPWQGSGEVVMFGADGYREISVGTGAAEGQTPPPPMTFRTLEGDALLRATLKP